MYNDFLAEYSFFNFFDETRYILCNKMLFNNTCL